MKKGILYLIPVFLSETDPSEVFPDENLRIISGLDNFIVEDLRTARRTLRKIGYEKNFDQVTFYLLNEHTDISEIYSFLDKTKQGEDIGLMSEAGIPCVADPGFEIVNLAHQDSLRVKPLIGPSSIVLALMASGFNGQQFVFHGYLPIDKPNRKNAILKLESTALNTNQTQIFIETPYRNNKLFTDLLSYCKAETKLCVARDITGLTEFIKTKTIGKWKNEKVDLHKVPAVFLINR
jgi:16S rRNA (cytidine1402-2'-O)-methyltransferase